MSGEQPLDPRPYSPYRVLLEALPLTAVAAIGLAWALTGEPRSTDAAMVASPARQLQPVHSRTAGELAKLFNKHDYDWPLQDDTVPALSLQSLPTDLGEQPVARKKSLFFRTLLPMVLAENRAIRQQRERLQSIIEHGGPADDEQKAFVDRLKTRYQVDGDLSDGDVRERLLRRVDTVPPALALAQAAIESGWGASRFAQQGNNLFGQWTWNAKLGLAPRDRRPGSNHFVRRFASLRQSVAGYFNNLNTHSAYAKLRELRANARAAGRKPSAEKLAQALHAYSQRGEKYVQDVERMLHANDLAAAVRGARLAPETVASEAD